MSFDTDTYREIACSLSRNKSRSTLTGFGVFWGLFMLLFMAGGGKGLAEILRNTFEGFAANATIVYSDVTTKPYKGFKEGRTWNLNEQDVSILQSGIPELQTVTPVIVSGGIDASYGSRSCGCYMKGIFADYGNVEKPTIIYGRYLNMVDVKQNRKVCVIGKRIYNSLFPDGSDPCGSFIQVGHSFYKVVGVDSNPGNFSVAGGADQTVFVPFSVMKQIFNTGGKVTFISMTGRDGVKMTDIEPRIRLVLSNNHILHPNDKSAVGIINTEQFFGIMEKLFSGVDLLILLVGLGTILSGFIGVSNIMMVTVKERTTEIGIRRAIGASPVQILSQILLESISLAFVAGFAGITFSVISLGLMDKFILASGYQNVSFQIKLWTAIGALVMLAILGTAAGFAPARRAMKIKPVDAIRDK